MLRILIGYREDLELSTRWWHRLAKVLFVLVCTIATAALAIGFAGVSYAPYERDVIKTDSLRAMTKIAPDDVANTIPPFLNAEGELGAAKRRRNGASRREHASQGDLFT